MTAGPPNVRPLSLAALGVVACAPGLSAQVDARLETREAAAVIRLSNPWSPSEGSGEHRRPGGKLANRGRHPVWVVFFVQPPLGFQAGEFQVEATDEGFRVQGRSEVVKLGDADRPIWFQGVLAPGDEVALVDWPATIRRPLPRPPGADRLQIGILVMAPEAGIALELLGFSPLGAEAPDPVERGLLFPPHVQLGGSHELPPRAFRTAGISHPNQEN